MLAKYVMWLDAEPDPMWGNPWRDILESIPHQKARLIDQRPYTQAQATVVVEDDGSIIYDPEWVEVEVMADE